MKLKNRIKESRNSLDLSQEELAQKLNVSKQTISNWENGNRIPDAQTLILLADIFDVSTDYLLGRTDDKSSILCDYNIFGNDIILEVSKDVYPNGLTKEEVIEKLRILKKLEELGIKFPSKRDDSE